ncbi:GH92 family glycosyl hydrolase [Flavobacterium pallidum]|uniref:Alpha-mannosidase n=1 Tax=Flavobacterium pallidum TaxID=2172098 RepID=A0A2S1SFQ1_9FLAO|nr:GH92 family glycosyl hydrolase [Flavobacterium pallidum]AWI25167.1 alpha-mannosidase [Flavobacterium pallidum]
MKFSLPFLLLFASTAIFSQNLSQSVNPFIGTGGHGHTFPGATLPFGMVQLSPDTRIDGSWDGCSGYHYSDSVIYGFSHSHLNGTGVSDFGDIMLMPTMGEPLLNNKEYASVFSHDNEKASAGFYSVKLDKYNIDVALTATTRVGLHQYTFHKSGQANIILDLNHRDKLLMGEVRIIDNKTIEVLRRSEAWARDQYVYARIEFSKPMKVTKVNNNAFAPAKTTDTFFAGSILALGFSSEVKQGEKISVKVALSPTGYQGARQNMSELKGWDFAKTKKAAEAAWNKELSKIEITTPDNDKKTVFYTALYHTMMQPNIAQDIDGKYRGRDNQIHVAEGFDYYSVFSLWDTFRAAHPLYTLIEKKRTADFINTFIKQYEQGGRLPVWELASNETDCMIGYHSVSVMADAMAKGIKGFDYEKAFEAAKHSAMQDIYGLDAYKKNSFISIDDEHESVSKTLEYAYDDWCIAQMAQLLHKKDDYQYFMVRSQSWKNIFDTETLSMRPKQNGGWKTPFDQREIDNNFTEGNSWHYSFFVPQDIPGMIDAYGGNEKFEMKLDQMFNDGSQTTGREQADVTGLIGQYAQGNEPSHHMAYLYNFIGKPEKTNEKIRYILDNFYKNAPDGLIGNEDCGQMSAWYVLSSIGLYAVTPGKAEWTTTKPYFDAKIHFEDGISKALAKEKNLKYFGITPVQSESVDMDYEKILQVPVINAKSKAFHDKMTLSLTADDPEAGIYYALALPGNNGEMVSVFEKYDTPFEIDRSSKIFFNARKGNQKSHVVTANFFKKPNNYTIDIKSKYNRQYSAGGPEGIIDGIYGSENWRKGDWQGYQSQDFEAIVDLQKEQKISEVSADFLQDSRAWILMPVKVEFYTSVDNVSFTLVKTIENNLDPKITDTKIIDFKSAVSPVNARYIKVKAYNYGPLPEWHQGYGGDAFIFIDEISIR